MMIIRGVNVYPSQIEAALLKVEKSLPHYQIILARKSGLDQMEVQVEVTAEMLRDRVGALEQLEKKMSAAIDHVVGLRVDVRLVEPLTIARSQGKAKRVIDKRKEGESL
jgi:phenylacetate-CoA ligase